MFWQDLKLTFECVFHSQCETTERWWCDILGGWAHRRNLPSALSPKYPRVSQPARTPSTWQAEDEPVENLNKLKMAAQNEGIPARFEFSLVHLIMQATTRKYEIKSRIKGMLFLSMKPSDAHTWTFDFSLPAPVIFLPAFLTGISSGIFCWEGECLEHLFRCHEVFLCWKLRRGIQWFLKVIVPYANNGSQCRVSTPPILPGQEINTIPATECDG